MLGLGAGMIKSGYQWQPSMVAGTMQLWLRSMPIKIASDGTVWLSSHSPGGVDIWGAQATAENTPTPISDGIGGMDFESDDNAHMDFNSAITISEQEAFMCFFVITLESVTSEGLLGQSTAAFIEITNNKKIKFKSTGTGGANVTAETTGTPFATGSKFVLGVKRDSGSTGNVHMYKNGTLLSQASQQASPGSIAIDTLGTKSNSNFFDGIMHEVIIYDTADLTPGDITRVSNYLINNHGI